VNGAKEIAFMRGCSMREAITALEQGSMARAAFGDQVVDHHARTEQGLFDRFVTDWERKRYFERI
jgi:glutamine synthetase